MVEDGEAREKEDPWLQMGFFQKTYRIEIHSQEF